jgi:Fe-S cluster assembly iron-binding protein IscA
MIEVTPKASQAIADYCRDKEKLPVRIFLKMGGCGIRSFGLALEAAQPSDKLFHIDGITYVVERKLLKQYGPIKLDSDGFSFRISGNGIYPPAGCGTCAYGCGSRGGTRCSGVCFRCETPCSTGQRIRARRKERG